MKVACGVRVALLAAAFVVQTANAAGHLQVGTTLIEINAGATAGRFSLSNSGDAPIGMQARVFIWTQTDNEDLLVPTKDLLLSPPIGRIAPGQEQVVRVVSVGAAPLDRDQTYRVIVEELPDGAAAPSTIAIRMRYVVPLYVRSAKASPAAVSCRVRSDAASKSSLVCVNTGGRSAQLGASRLTGSGAPYELTPGLLGYVLPGSTRAWDLETTKLVALGQAVAFETHVNGQSASLALSTPP